MSNGLDSNALTNNRLTANALTDNGTSATGQDNAAAPRVTIIAVELPQAR